MSNNLVLQFEFRVPSYDDARLAHWFSAALELEVPERDADADERPADRYLAHVLSLAARMLRAAKVPVLGEPRALLPCRPSTERPGFVHANVGFPVPQGLAPGCPELALREAVQACKAMLDQPFDATSCQPVFERLKEAISQIDARVPGGKSTVPVIETAHRLGIPVLYLEGGVYQLGWGSRALRIDRSSTERDAPHGAMLVQDKARAAKLLSAAGLPGPQHELVRSREQAGQVAERLGWPVVIKPADADRGEGVTIDIRSTEALEAAFDHAIASSRSRRVLVERQASPICHRLFVTAGKLLFGMRRAAISVTGDGRSTVSALIDEANRKRLTRPPWSRTPEYPADALALEYMARAGWTPDGVPPEGERVPLRPMQSDDWGGTRDDVTAQVHPDNAALACRAARLFDLEVAGVDLLVDDISRPWYETGAVISEVNYSPTFGQIPLQLAYIPEYLRRLLGGNGRIPIESCVGDTGWTQALARQRKLVKKGLRAFVTDASRTLGPDGREHHLSCTGRDARVDALLLDRGVDALIVVVPAGRTEVAGKDGGSTS